jgi:hypothetical protein
MARLLMVAFRIFLFTAIFGTFESVPGMKADGI